MKNEFWRKPDLDEKRWYGSFRAETDGNVVRYRMPVPTVRGALVLMVITAVSVCLLIGLGIGLTLIVEAIGRGTPA